MKILSILSFFSSRRISCAFSLIIALANCSSAETILLKSGKYVDGIITEQNDKLIRVDPGIGFSVTYYRDEIKQIFDQQKANERNFIWQIRSSSTLVYILGSIRLANPQFFPFAPTIEEAFNQSSFLVLAGDGAQIDQSIVQKKLLERASYPDGQQLKDSVSTQFLLTVKKFLSRYDLDLTYFNTFKPWFIARSLGTAQFKKLGYSEDNGINRYFLKKVKDPQKIIELENLDEQITVLESVQDQDLLLKYTIQDLEKTENSLNYIVSAWQNGDSVLMEKLLISDGLNQYPETLPIYEKLLFERNQRMAQKIGEYLKTDQIYFIVVEAAHLLGDKGILEILRKQGYPVSQM